MAHHRRDELRLASRKAHWHSGRAQVLMRSMPPSAQAVK
jgi:hypothetical protein